MGREIESALHLHVDGPARHPKAHPAKEGQRDHVHEHIEVAVVRADVVLVNQVHPVVVPAAPIGEGVRKALLHRVRQRVRVEQPEPKGLEAVQGHHGARATQHDYYQRFAGLAHSNLVGDRDPDNH